jgi:hypothetical protein
MLRQHFVRCYFSEDFINVLYFIVMIRKEVINSGVGV